MERSYNFRKSLEFALENYCKVCKTKYSVYMYSGTYRDKCRSANINHIRGYDHNLNQERFDFYSCYIFLYVFYNQLNE